jgi:serine/threonine protein kinase
METDRRQLRQRERRTRFLGRYELVEELARGGMGSVFLALHAGEAGFQRLFAIKVMHEHLADESGFVDMLRDEARIAARIHHPNVVPVVDIGTQGNEHYIVMDYIEGPAFSTLWKRSANKLPLELAISIVVDALEGLHAAHLLKDDNGEDLRLIHRDVSPPNILVGIDGVARLTDFGVAKAESRLASTRPGMRKGKLQYMSPEQLDDSKLLDRRTDLWSIGVLLWNVLTREWLFTGDSDAAILHAVMNKKVPPPSTMAAKPPACFDDIVLRALERSPAARFSTAIEMAETLRKRATENKMLGSRRQVSDWVEKTFGEDLARRRAAIREVVRIRSAAPMLNDLSRITVVPSLLSPVKTISLDDKGLISSTDPWATNTQLGTAFGNRMGMIGKTPLWIVAALAVVALIIALMISLRPPSTRPAAITSRDSIKGDAPRPPPTAPTTTKPKPEMEPTPALEAPASEPTDELKAANARTEVNTPTDGEAPLKKYKHLSRKSRPAERPTGLTSVATPKVSKPVTPDLKPFPYEPRTKPASLDDFESNPYVQR